MSSKIGLWILRKALYTAVGSAVTVFSSQLATAGPSAYDFSHLTIAGAIGGFSAAVVGDLRRALVPDLFQVATGQDPRNDG